jgi:lysozyme family protein
VQERLRQDGHKPVPWWFIAIVSVREYGGPPHWDKQLGQGDALAQVSHNDPAAAAPSSTTPATSPRPPATSSPATTHGRAAASTP